MIVMHSSKRGIFLVCRISLVVGGGGGGDGVVVTADILFS